MTQAAHRRSTLRFWLAVVAALEAGDAIAIVGGWTPGRAAVAAVALGAGGTAAFAAVVLMGTTRPIGRWLGATIRLVLVASCVVPLAAGSIADPTQARIPDLTLSVACSVSPDAATVVARADFSWTRLDLWPAGLTGSSGSDSLAIYPELPDWISAALDIVAPDGYPPMVSATTMDPGPWTASIDPDSRTLNGLPTGALLTTAAPSGWNIGPLLGGTSGSAAVSVRNAALQAGGRYELTWTFSRNADYEPERSNRDVLPVFVVEYQHLTRFTVQALGSCADPSHALPNRSAEWLQY
jgi:hypothetical protein